FGMAPLRTMPGLKQGAWTFGGPGGFGNFSYSGSGVMTTVFRTGDRFTARHQEGTLIITLTGSASSGKAKVNEIHVQDGGTSHRYEAVDDVPERYRDKVKNLVELSEKQSAKLDVNAP